MAVSHAPTPRPARPQEVESKYLNHLSRASTSQAKRLRHLDKLNEQAAEYGALLRRELAQDPLLGPMNARQVGGWQQRRPQPHLVQCSSCPLSARPQVYPFTAVNTSSVNMDAVDLRLSGFCPEADLWNQRMKFRESPAAAAPAPR